MAIVDCEDIRFVIPNLSEDKIRSIVADREFAVIKVPPEVYNNPRKYNHIKWDLSIIGYNDHSTLEVECENEAEYKTYLWINGFSTPIIPNKINGVEITYPSIDELVKMLHGKKLIFLTLYEGRKLLAEERVNELLQEDVFRLRNEEEYYIEDRCFEIRVFLQRISDVSTPTNRFIEPIDIGTLDICGKILLILEKASNAFYNDAWTVTYASESPELMAQYLLAKFHSNKEWDADPVCILNCRMTAFVLPCEISSEEIDDTPEDRIAYDLAGETKYLIDSIHINKDVCTEISELEEPFWWYDFDVSVV